MFLGKITLIKWRKKYLFFTDLSGVKKQSLNEIFVFIGKIWRLQSCEDRSFYISISTLIISLRYF
ncbi:hypothetical protein P886_1327 [Alteromonadaceae bacterium 2753L.S.0a.02]|nr:hypothetical protein P886_1327 [Alteromonadaceae bacterium 2753L.S.0a.02]